MALANQQLSIGVVLQVEGRLVVGAGDVHPGEPGWP